MKRILVPLSDELKARLDMKRAQGYSINGFVRAVLTEALRDVKLPRGGRRAA